MTPESECPHCFGYGGLHVTENGVRGQVYRVHPCRLCRRRCAVPIACAVEYALLALSRMANTPTQGEVTALAESYGLHDQANR